MGLVRTQSAAKPSVALHHKLKARAQLRTSVLRNEHAANKCSQIDGFVVALFQFSGQRSATPAVHLTAPQPVEIC